MFWRVAGYAQASPIEGILDKESFTLEELLDEDGIIQECKALNGRLLDFLKQASVVQQLVTYLVIPAQPADDGKSDDVQRALRYPYVACEVFCCEVDALYTTLLGSEELTELLFSIVKTSTPPDITLAGYFARVVRGLLVQRTADVMQYLRTHPETLRELTDHLGTTSVAEVVVQIAGADDVTACYLGPAQLAWLSESHLMDLILQQLLTAAQADSQRNAAAVLAAIARSQSSPLLANFRSSDLLGKLFRHAFTSAGTVSSQALDVCIALLEPKMPVPNSYQSPAHGASQGDMQVDPAVEEADQQLKALSVEGLIPYMKTISQRLEVLDSEPFQDTPFGRLCPPLGQTRLKAAELIGALVRLGNADAENAIIAAGLQKKLLDLFMCFPFNNLLHQQTAIMLYFALENGTDNLLAHLLEECQLLQWVAHAPQEVKPEPRPMDERGAERPPIRAGNLGHLTLIANRLVEVGPRRELLQKALDSSEEWNSKVLEVLAEANARQNTSAWNCGRPQAVSSLRLEAGRLLADGEGEGEGEAPAQPLPSARASNHRYGGMEEEDDDFFTGGTVRLRLAHDRQAAGDLAKGCMADCRGADCRGVWPPEDEDSNHFAGDLHDLGDVSGHLAGFHITEGAHSLSLAGRNLNPALGLAARGGSPPRGVDELDDPPGFPPTAVRPIGPVGVQKVHSPLAARADGLFSHRTGISQDPDDDAVVLQSHQPEGDECDAWAADFDSLAQGRPAEHARETPPQAQQAPAATAWQATQDATDGKRPGLAASRTAQEQADSRSFATEKEPTIDLQNPGSPGETEAGWAAFDEAPAFDDPSVTPTKEIKQQHQQQPGLGWAAEQKDAEQPPWQQLTEKERS